MLPVLVSAGWGLYKLNIVDEHAAYGPHAIDEAARVIGEPNNVPFRLVYDIQALSPPMEQVNGLADLFFVDLYFRRLGAVLHPWRDIVMGPADAAALADQGRDELDRDGDRGKLVGIEDEAFFWIALEPIQQDIEQYRRLAVAGPTRDDRQIARVEADVQAIERSPSERVLTRLLPQLGEECVQYKVAIWIHGKILASGLRSGA